MKNQLDQNNYATIQLVDRTQNLVMLQTKEYEQINEILSDEKQTEDMILTAFLRTGVNEDPQILASELSTTIEQLYDYFDKEHYSSDEKIEPWVSIVDTNISGY